MKRVVLAILLMALPKVCMAETATARDAVLALRSLDKLTATGAVYQTYAYCLRDAKSDVDAYLKGDAAKRNRKLNQAISETMGLYEYADVLFKRMNDAKGLISVDADASPADKKLVSRYFLRFPEDKKDIAEGGVIVKQQGGAKLKINAAISKIFKRASKKHLQAESLLEESD